MQNRFAAHLLPLWLLASFAAFPQTSPRVTVNGKALTETQLEVVTKVAPPELRPLIVKDPKELLRFYGFIDRMAELAEKANLDADSVVKERLAFGRKQILADELMQRYGAAHPVTAEDEQQYYEGHLDDYTSALVKVIFVPVRPTAGAKAANARADELARQLTHGANFDALAKRYPVEGNFSNVIGKRDAATPEAIRTAVFALSPGGTTAPITLSNGVYLIQLEKIGVKPLADARGEIVQQIATDRFLAWVNEVRSTVVVEPPSQ